MFNKNIIIINAVLLWFTPSSILAMENSNENVSESLSTVFAMLESNLDQIELNRNQSNRESILQWLDADHNNDSSLPNIQPNISQPTKKSCSNLHKKLERIKIKQKIGCIKYHKFIVPSVPKRSTVPLRITSQEPLDEECNEFTIYTYPYQEKKRISHGKSYGETKLDFLIKKNDAVKKTQN